MITKIDNNADVVANSANTFCKEFEQLIQQGYTYVEGSSRLKKRTRRRAKFVKAGKAVVDIVVPDPLIQEVLEPAETIVSDKVVDETAVPDWDFIKSLNNANDQKGSKEKLAAYILENYNITLKKNVSFDKMVTKLENTLS